jgi:hypothetical protein
MEQGVYKEFVRNWKAEGGRQEQKAEGRKQRTKHKDQQFSASCLWTLRLLQECATQNHDGDEIDAE